MKISIYLFAALCLLTFNGFTQNQQKIKLGLDKQDLVKNISCQQIKQLTDCSNAIPLRAKGEVVFHCLPMGTGKLLEFNHNPIGNLYYFEKEHNSLWIRFKIMQDGIFAFKITPTDTLADLDFLLFNKMSDDYCAEIITKRLKPIRTNISKPDGFNFSETGLSLTAQQQYVGAGKGEAYSKALKVKKGEEYVLVIDKVNEDGNGEFTLKFQYFDYTVVSGTLIDGETAAPLIAEMVWEDANTGEVLSKVTTDAFTGEFNMKVPYEISNPKAKYLLTTEKKGYFFIEKELSAEAVEHISSKPLVVVLPRLKKGMFSQIKSINFYTGEDKVLPKSRTSLRRLKKVMFKNPSLIIRIDGHTNGCDPTVDEMQILSDARATAIKNYLIKNNINEKRIFTKGFNCSHMIYPDPKDENEETVNRRVEILVLDF